PWIMHQADILVERERDIPGGKLLWGQCAVAMEGAILVQPLPIERRRWGTEMDGQDPVNHMQELVFGSPDVVHRGALGDRVAQRSSCLPQLPLQDSVHAHGVG